MPLIGQKITITDKGDSFINWKRGAGYDRKRDTYKWTSVALAAAGIAAIGCSSYLGSDDFAIDHTDSYDEYTEWKDKMKLLGAGGVCLSVSAIIPAIMAIRSHSKYTAQMEELKK